MTDLEDFERFMQEREAAARRFVNGDVAPLGRIVAMRAPATFFGPGGGHTGGPREVYALYESDSARFAVGDTHFEVLHMGAGDGLAYWTGIQVATARLQGAEKAVPMKLRVTEIFRREGMAWKLVHRHADAHAEPAPA